MGELSDMYMYADKRMKELLEKYLNGTATPDEVKLVDEWYDSLRSAKRDAETNPESEHSRLSAAWSRVHPRLSKSPEKVRAMWPKISAVAAAFIGVVMIVYFLVPATERQGRSDDKIAVTDSVGNTRMIENTTAEMRRILLSDGSIVELYPKSSLRVDDYFQVNERSVTLSGRASFDVAKDASKPFYVFTGEVVTKVVGTSFTIDAYPERREITVEVRSGAVSIYTQVDDRTPGSGVLLKPNQQAVYSKSNRRVSRSLVKQPRIVNPITDADKIRFDGAAVSDILTTLERMYGVEIEFDKESFSACSMTTAISRGDLYEKIDVICEITGSRYTIEDTRIVIAGEGCN